jgi:branched-chain amino acid transport system substrate-binding protein
MARNFNKPVFFMSILALILCLGSYTAEAGKLSEASVKVGVLMPVTGTIAYEGGLTIEGIKLAAEEINAKGGIDGVTKIKLIIEDSRCVPSESVNAMEKLVGVDGVAVVIGDFCSSCTLADMEVAKREKVPLITPISIAPKITQQGNIWVFRGCDSAEMMAKAFTKVAIKELKINKWAFIAVNDDYGRGSVTAYTKRVNNLGGKIVFCEYYQHGETDYYPILTKLKASDANGLAMIGEVMDNSTCVKQWMELGLGKKMRLMDPTSALLSEKFIELTKGGADGMIAATRFVDSIETPEAKKFVADYRKKWGHNPVKHSQSGYDCMKIVEQAIKRAGSINPTNIRSALTKTNYEGPQGKANFDSTNQLIISEYIVKVEGKKFKVLAGPISVTD